MNKQEIYSLIEKRKIWHKITEHGAVFNMAELSEVDLPYPELIAKNIFVRDDKKKNYYLITVKDNKHLNLKEFKTKYNTRHLSFASGNDLADILNLTPGSVSPLGLLNDSELKVKFYLDKDFIFGESIIGVHPNDNTATLWLKVEDLLNTIREHGNEVILADI